ncbi:phosphate/phosphite/phosphonate ABC transporter substrate-binding protein [Vaginisenegalia massiliensis]|uniref:phosphate/phosphite/phosphonate ABC transporter substrate-binding protein n=1 Tax=Vaginisenegalia massiliensis TaxID=2058294 RepID=UPI000F54A685|nr:phosphate/phosphite/phosphonate ABC transporter substrate-binding protein [Vaginisenegalia massiliensis]
MKKIKALIAFVLCLTLASIFAPLTQVSARADELTIVWYPNESGADLKESREQISGLVEKATGKKVKNLTTTDYNIAIEAIASGQANLAFMGGQGYVQAHELNDKVVPLVVMSGKSGTLDDAVYYSWLNVLEKNADQYKDDKGEYSIDKIKGKKMSFVSESSTSGFVIPTSVIIDHFKDEKLEKEALMEGGKDKFFSEVMFGGSHQGSLFNVISGKADVAAACDTCVINYVEPVEGNLNEVGTVYQVRKDAEQPFDKNAGDRFVAIAVTPVLNSPFAVNTEKTDEETAKKLKELFTSKEFRDQVFISEKDKEAGKKGLFYAEEKNQFVEGEDSFYDPIRKLQ